jgi:tetratricopeptide (TPR) repeat protein
MLKDIIFLLILSNISFQSVSSEEIRRTDDSTIITWKMADPTDSEDAMDEYNIGTKYLNEENYEEAEYHLLRAIEFDPEFVDALDHLGLTYRKEKKYDEAELAYLKSIEIMPLNLVPYINLALVYRYQGKLNSAKDLLLKAYEIDKDEPEVFYGLGFVFYDAKYYAESIQYFKIALAKYSERDSMRMCDASYMIGENCYLLNDYNEALKYYKIALLGFPENEHLIKRINEIENHEENDM